MSGQDPNHGKVTGMTTAAVPETVDEVLTELASLRETIDAADEARKRRLELWLVARQWPTDGDEPRPTFARLAQVSGVAEPYVIRVVGKELAPAPAKKVRRR